MFRIKIALLGIGIALAAVGMQEYRLAAEAKETPQTITCADLAAKGPGDNAHVNVTKTLLCTHSYVYESKSKSDNSTWKTVWVPVVPIDGEYVKTLEKLAEDGNPVQQIPPPTDLRILFKSSNVTNQAELEGLASAHSLTGLVINKIASIGGEERKMLEQSYPGIDFSKCYIIDHERKPAGAGKLAGFIGGGAALALVGGVWLLAGFARKA